MLAAASEFPLTPTRADNSVTIEAIKRLDPNAKASAFWLTATEAELDPFADTGTLLDAFHRVVHDALRTKILLDNPTSLYGFDSL